MSAAQSTAGGSRALTHSPAQPAPSPAKSAEHWQGRAFEENDPAQAMAASWGLSAGANAGSPPLPPAGPPAVSHSFSNVSIYPGGPLPVQTQLTIGQPNAPYEQEADRVADQVMRMAAPPPSVQRQDIEEDGGPDIRRSPDTAQPTAPQPDLENRLNASRSGGSHLPNEVRQFMEPRFGFDFSKVKVHNDADAVQMNRELGAQAFAHGNHIYYGAGKAPANDHLTGHELTHVVQQTGGVLADPNQVQAQLTSYIQRDGGSEGDQTAEAVTQGSGLQRAAHHAISFDAAHISILPPSSDSSPSLQRQCSSCPSEPSPKGANHLPRSANSAIGTANDPYEQEADRPSPPALLGWGTQAKLTIGQPNDVYEQEADRVAEQVMSTSSAATPIVQPQVGEEESEKLQTKPLAETITPLVQRQANLEEDEPIQAKCEACEAEEPIQRFADGTAQAQPDLENRLNATQGGGSALPDDVRSFMEPRFGADFSQVRVHTSSDAVQMNRELGAQAFTHGHNVYFGAGKCPGTDALTAHELTHVVQQSAAVQTKPSPPVQKQPNVCQGDERQINHQLTDRLTGQQSIQREMIPGYTKQFVFMPKLRLPQPIVQCEKIDHRTITWADFQGKAPKKSSYDAATYSDYAKPGFEKIAPDSKTLEATDTKQACDEKQKDTKSKKQEKTKFKVNIEIDPSKIEVKPYMLQEKSWVAAWNIDEKAAISRCKKLRKAGITECEEFISREHKSAEKECKKDEQDCKTAFKEKDPEEKDFDFSIKYDGKKITATSEDECSKVLLQQCNQLMKEQVFFEGGNGEKATTKAECGTKLLEGCSEAMNADSKNLLAHEQAHFDITKVKAQQTQNALRSMVDGFEKEVEDCTEAKALKKARDTLAKNISKLKKEFEKQHKAWNATQKSYDADTAHGTKATEQGEWKAKIDQGLPD